MLWAKSYGGPKDDGINGITYANNRLYLTGGFNSPTLSFGSIILNDVNTSLVDTQRPGFLNFIKTGIYTE